MRATRDGPVSFVMAGHVIDDGVCVQLAVVVSFVRHSDIDLVCNSGATLRYDASKNIATLTDSTQTAWRTRSTTVREKKVLVLSVEKKVGIPWSDDDRTPKD